MSMLLEAIDIVFEQTRVKNMKRNIVKFGNAGVKRTTISFTIGITNFIIETSEDGGWILKMDGETEGTYKTQKLAMAAAKREAAFQSR